MPRSAALHLAPLLTALVLAGMAAYSLASIDAGGSSEAYFARVRTAIDDLPTRIGGYIGEDRPALPAAVEMLRPNRLLQREYVDPLSGRSFSVLIVHCGDVRDMMGHYPPICYPSNGWSVDEAEVGGIARPGNAGPIPVTTYRVSRDAGRGGTRAAKTVTNTFVVPRRDDPLGPDDATLDRVTRTRWSSGLGAAQIQVITDATMTEEERGEIERLVAAELGGVIAAIASVDRSAGGRDR
ncbi:MAG: exosortase-associated EpsI family protein [Planctomycetota bacterium]